MAFKVYLMILVASMHRSIDAANILLLPISYHSHCLQAIGIGNELTKRGHFVVAYVASSFQTHCFDHSNVTVVRFEASQTYQRRMKLLENMLEDIIFRGNVPHFNYTFMSYFTTVARDYGESMMKSTEELKILKKMKLDFAIVDGVPTGESLFYIPRYLNIPTASFGSHLLPEYTAMPLQSHTQPYALSTFTTDMNLIRRVTNTFITIMAGSIFNCLAYFDGRDINTFKGHLPDDVLECDKRELAGNSTLYLENTDPIIDFPKAVYPNCIQVGGLTTRKANPLPEKLEQYFTRAKNGIIVVSFGSLLTRAPKPFFEKMLRIFDRFNQSVIMPYDKEIEQGNVKTIPWLPQNDVLGHPNTVLFVSHCGKNGLFEALYHGVPVVCTPLHTDQFFNSIKAKYHNIAASVDIVNEDEDTIVAVIQDALHDKTIAKNMNRLSIIYRAGMFTPQERAVNAIEHVLKFGGKHLRSVSSDLPIYSQTMMDVWVTLFLLATIILYIEYRIIRCCWICLICNKRQIGPKTKHD